jgi:phosphomannomutase
MNDNIFKAYDVRGLSPEEINETTAYKIGCSFAKFVGRGTVVVGMDNRETSPILKQKLIKGLVSSGSRVIDLGLSSTPMFYFAVGALKADGGVCVTASHNPKEYNGFKFTRKNAVPVNEGFGLEKIKERYSRIEFEEREGGSVEETEFLDKYIDFNLSKFNLDDFKDFNIVIDTANAVSSLDISTFKDKFTGKITHLFYELDSSYPNHGLNPLEEKNVSSLIDSVMKEKSDLGVALDGDGDRIIFVDENGKTLRSDIILGIILSDLIKEGDKIAYDFRASKSIKEFIEEKGGIPILERAGNPFVKHAMRENETVFSGEVSGHFFHRDFFYSECSLFVLLKIMEIMNKTKKTLSELAKPFEKYSYSGEINFEVEDKDEVIKKIEENYTDGEVSKIDGLKIDFKDWWFLIRKSNTQLLIRLIIEADNDELLEEKKKELTELIK